VHFYYALPASVRGRSIEPAKNILDRASGSLHCALQREVRAVALAYRCQADGGQGEFGGRLPHIPILS